MVAVAVLCTNLLLKSVNKAIFLILPCYGTITVRSSNAQHLLLRWTTMNVLKLGLHCSIREIWHRLQCDSLFLIREIWHGLLVIVCVLWERSDMDSSLIVCVLSRRLSDSSVIIISLSWRSYSSVIICSLSGRSGMCDSSCLIREIWLELQCDSLYLIREIWYGLQFDSLCLIRNVWQKRIFILGKSMEEME